MSSKGHEETPGSIAQPTDLRFVGPATAECFEDAPFEPVDLRDRTVSYAELIEAGVNPGVAGKLRREYSLVWSFKWVAGANLRYRAKNVGGLDTEQRQWIAASPSSRDEGHERVTKAERAWRERSSWVNEPGKSNCERCGDSLVTLRLGESRSVQCESCGYVGVPAQL